jgi:hypothetical protein
MQRKNLQQWQFCGQSVMLALQCLNLALELTDAHILDGLSLCCRIPICYNPAKFTWKRTEID